MTGNTIYDPSGIVMQLLYTMPALGVLPCSGGGVQFAFPMADEAVHHALLYHMGNLYALLSFLPKR